MSENCRLWILRLYDFPNVELPKVSFSAISRNRSVFFSVLGRNQAVAKRSLALMEPKKYQLFRFL